MAIADSAVSLLFKIKADGSNAEAELKKFINLLGKEVVGSSQTATAGLKQLTDQIFSGETAMSGLAGGAGAVVAGIGAVATTAVGLGVTLFELTKKASDYGVAIYDASVKTGLSAEKISALKFLGDESGVSIQQLTTAIDIFEKKLGTAAEGSKSAAKLLVRLGLDPKKAYDDLDASFEKTINKLQGMHDGAAKTTLVMETFGAKTGANVLKVLDAMHGKSLPETIAALKKLGVTIDDEAAKNADEFRKTLKLLDTQFEATSSKVLLTFAPDIVKGMKLISDALTDNQSAIKTWSTNLKYEVGGVIAYFNDLNKAVKNYQDQKSKPFLQKADEFFFSPETIEANRKNPIGRPGTIGTQEDILETLRKRGFLEEQLHPSGDLGLDPADVFKFKDKILDESKTAKGKKSFGESEAEKFHKKVLELADAHGFTESSYRRPGKQINAGSLHGAGLADDFSVRGKSVAEVVGLIAGGIKDGFRTLDERIKRPGIKSTGPNIHLERGGTKASIFGSAAEYGPDGAATLAYLKDLDRKRLNKKGGTADDVEAFTEKRKAEIEKERDDRIQALEDVNKAAKEFDDQDKEDRLAELDDLHEKGLIKETEYAHEVGAIKLAQLEKDYQVNEDLRKSKDVQSSPDKLNEVTNESVSLVRQIGQQKAENNRNEEAALVKINEEYGKELDTLRKLREENRQGEIQQTDTQKATERELLVEQTRIGNAQDRLLALKVLREFDLEEITRKAEESRLEAELAHDEELDSAKQIKDKELRIKAEDEINKKYERRLQLINQLENKQSGDVKKGIDPQISDAERRASGGIAGQAADIFGGLFGHADNKDANGKIKSQADYLKGVYKDIAGSAKQATGDMVQGLAGLVQQWIV